jgi:hypothetical protein
MLDGKKGFGWFLKLFLAIMFEALNLCYVHAFFNCKVIQIIVHNSISIQFCMLIYFEMLINIKIIFLVTIFLLFKLKFDNHFRLGWNFEPKWFVDFWFFFTFIELFGLWATTSRRKKISLVNYALLSFLLKNNGCNILDGEWL